VRGHTRHAYPSRVPPALSDKLASAEPTRAVRSRRRPLPEVRSSASPPSRSSPQFSQGVRGPSIDLKISRASFRIIWPSRMGARDGLGTVASSGMSGSIDRWTTRKLRSSAIPSVGGGGGSQPDPRTCDSPSSRRPLLGDGAANPMQRAARSVRESYRYAVLAKSPLREDTGPMRHSLECSSSSDDVAIAQGITSAVRIRRDLFPDACI
jgi:hypothetical protein